MKLQNGHKNGQASIQEGEVGSTSPSSFMGSHEALWIGAAKMFPDLTRDDVFRLETRRLWLRWPRHADVAAIVRLAGEKQVAEMTALVPHPYPDEAAVTFVFESRKGNALGRSLRMAIAPRKKPQQLIGMIGIDPAPEDGRPHLGYWLGKPHWGKGYATEAARALVDAWFAYTEADELTSAARTANPASRRVLEKCGFAHAGTGPMAFPARAGVLPVDRFRLDRRAWERLTPWADSGLVPHRRPRERLELAAAL
jgi:RimJ/RimL family protein N-acetyltransferase